MAERRRRESGPEWTPATSDPGELYTVEGRIRAVGAFARGMKHTDPRLRPYRRQMWKSALTVIALGIGALVAAAVVTSIF